MHAYVAVKQVEQTETPFLNKHTQDVSESLSSSALDCPHCEQRVYACWTYRHISFIGDACTHSQLPPQRLHRMKENPIMCTTQALQCFLALLPPVPLCSVQVHKAFPQAMERVQACSTFSRSSSFPLTHPEPEDSLWFIFIPSTIIFLFTLPYWAPVQYLDG